MSTLVCYHLPCDKDDSEHPNAYPIRKSAEDITLRDVKETFPLPGEYHFRFKVKVDSGSYWMDITDESEFVPIFAQRRIVAKVLRINWANQKKAGSRHSTSEIPKPEISSRPQAFSGIDLFGGNIPIVEKATLRTGKQSNPVSDLDLFS
jgi:hypothetical protein